MLILAISFFCSALLATDYIPNVTENFDLGPSQSPGAGQSQLGRISNTDDVEIAPAAGAFASAQNQVFNHVRYNTFFQFLVSMV